MRWVRMFYGSIIYWVMYKYTVPPIYANIGKIKMKVEQIYEAIKNLVNGLADDNGAFSTMQ